MCGRLTELGFNVESENFVAFVACRLGRKAGSSVFLCYKARSQHWRNEGAAEHEALHTITCVTNRFHRLSAQINYASLTWLTSSAAELAVAMFRG